jgi:hypothetical protein
MNHKAIRTLYPNVIVISEEFGIFDANNNIVEIDLDAVNSWVDPEAYKSKRQAEYPSITDYIDGIVKGDQAQVQAYIDACLAVKIKYPKPT